MKVYATARCADPSEQCNSSGGSSSSSSSSSSSELLASYVVTALYVCAVWLVLQYRAVQ
mgnify:CR=1